MQFLLRCYGKDVDLIDLARETQWPDFEAGARLDALEQALQKRGVYTAALRINPRVRIRWPHPVLIHLKGSPETGHYVVWLPTSTGDRVDVWVGLSGIQSGEADRLAERCSGVVLLTSPELITYPATAVYRPLRLFPWIFASVSLALFVAVLKPGVYRSLRQRVQAMIKKNANKLADLVEDSEMAVRVPQQGKEPFR